MFKNYSTNNPGIATKVMDVLKGFRTIDKILPQAADENIEACMICQATATEAGVDGVVSLAKGYDGTGVPYFAFNNWFDDDAQSVKYSTQGDGSGVGSRIIGIPLHGAVELVITLDKLSEADTTGYQVGADVYALQASAGQIGLNATAASGDIVVGTVTEVRENAVVIYPVANGAAKA